MQIKHKIEEMFDNGLPEKPWGSLMLATFTWCHCLL